MVLQMDGGYSTISLVYIRIIAGDFWRTVSMDKLWLILDSSVLRLRHGLCRGCRRLLVALIANVTPVKRCTASLRHCASYCTSLGGKTTVNGGDRRFINEILGEASLPIPTHLQSETNDAAIDNLLLLGNMRRALRQIEGEEVAEPKGVPADDDRTFGSIRCPISKRLQTLEASEAEGLVTEVGRSVKCGGGGKEVQSRLHGWRRGEGREGERVKVA
mmetsp:Transcript_12518/g.25143  ORF Transcript_12518/g.25143 Transcript_12518/m.25143 type:complete len:217 (-) Transcript_12518:339-989(-)